MLTVYQRVLRERFESLHPVLHRFLGEVRGGTGRWTFAGFAFQGPAPEHRDRARCPARDFARSMRWQHVPDIAVLTSTAQIDLAKKALAAKTLDPCRLSLQACPHISVRGIDQRSQGR